MLVLAGSTVFPWKARQGAVTSSCSRLEVCSEIAELPRDGHSRKARQGLFRAHWQPAHGVGAFHGKTKRGDPAGARSAVQGFLEALGKENSASPMAMMCD